MDPEIKIRTPNFPHAWIEHALTLPEQLIERLAGATIAVANKVRISREVIQATPSLQLIAVAATGTDSVDVEACRDLGVAVTNVRRYSTHSVAEHTLMLMLAATRQLHHYVRRTRLGVWNHSTRFYLEGPQLFDLHGQTLAIVGRGTLGISVGHLAQAFGMRVVWAERKNAPQVRPGYIEFGAALQQADFVSLHCPFTPAYQDLIGAAELALMKPNAILINTSRGKLINEPALLAALRNRQIAGAAVDVVVEEPPVAGNLLIDAQLDHLLVTPHVAWASMQAKQALVDELIDCMDAFARGESMNRLV